MEESAIAFSKAILSSSSICAMDLGAKYPGGVS